MSVTYESDAEEWHQDFAARWANIFGPLDVGLSFFRGTGREPTLLPANAELDPTSADFRLRPHYSVVDQVGLEMQWTGENAQGRSVLLSEEWGPAVVGFLKPQIVLPRWCRDLDDDDLDLILDHEAEHLRAGDLRLLLVAGILPILAPWNLPIWWQLGRLRIAVEGD